MIQTKLKWNTTRLFFRGIIATLLSYLSNIISYTLEVLWYQILSSVQNKDIIYKSNNDSKTNEILNYRNTYMIKFPKRIELQKRHYLFRNGHFFVLYILQSFNPNDLNSIENDINEFASKIEKSKTDKKAQGSSNSSNHSNGIIH